MVEKKDLGPEKLTKSNVINKDMKSKRHTGLRASMSPPIDEKSNLTEEKKQRPVSSSSASRATCP